MEGDGLSGDRGHERLDLADRGDRPACLGCERGSLVGPPDEREHPSAEAEHGAGEGIRGRRLARLDLVSRREQLVPESEVEQHPEAVDASPRRVGAETEVLGEPERPPADGEPVDRPAQPPHPVPEVDVSPNELCPGAELAEVAQRLLQVVEPFLEPELAAGVAAKPAGDRGL